MEIKLLSPAAQAQFDNEILNMLTAGENEFFPPLSARSSTTQATFSGSAKSANGIKRYFEEMKKQRLLVAVENGVLLGFVSFKENYTTDVIGAKHLPNIYISTLLVSPSARGKGLTRQMYTALFKLYADRNIFTRTWSSNTAHIHILAKFGFKTLCTLKDDRGPGIDTVYFIRSVT